MPPTMLLAGDVRGLTPSSSDWPRVLNARLAEYAPTVVFIHGSPTVLACRRTAFFCSARTPGDAILRSYDSARRWRDDEVTVVSGFHSPIEKECLRILLRGRQPVVVCLARGLEGMRLPSEWRKPLEGERLLLVSSLAPTVRRVTKELAVTRNRLVAALADEVVFAHVTPGGQLDALRQTVEGWGIPVRTLRGVGEAGAGPYG